MEIVLGGGDLRCSRDLIAHRHSLSLALCSSSGSRVWPCEGIYFFGILPVPRGGGRITEIPSDATFACVAPCNWSSISPYSIFQLFNCVPLGRAPLGGFCFPLSFRFINWVRKLMICAHLGYGTRKVRIGTNT